MLLQSHGDELLLLPSLPAAWAAGSFSGLRARGGVEVDASWEAGELTSLTLRASRSGSLRLKLPGSHASPGAFLRGPGGVQPVTADNGILSLDLRVGGSYDVDPQVTQTNDKDSDGFNDYKEWLAGTNPYKPNSFPNLSIRRTSTGLLLSWEELAGRQYCLEYSSDLITWDELLLREATTKETFSHRVDPSAPDTRFYRIDIQAVEE
jgi:hypothetical protein